MNISKSILNLQILNDSDCANMFIDSFVCQLAQEIAKATKEGKLSLTIGGDHR